MLPVLGRRPEGPHFLVDEVSAIDEHRVTLDAPDAHHLGVRRVAPGDPISVGDGRGRLYQARVESIGPRSAAAAIEGVYEEPRPAPGITVVQGLAKGSKVDWAVEKMVELGVDRIVVFFAGRSVPTWDEAKATAAAQRWQRVARAAAKQSRRAWLPRVDGPVSLADAAETLQGRLAIVADPTSAFGLRETLNLHPIGDIALVVGPEGGLEPEETALLEGAGAVPVRLGSQILRTETAGIALAAAVMFHLGRFG